MEQCLTFGERATQYALDVIEGRIVSCRWVRLACERHFNDLARAGTDDFPYLFNPELKDQHGKVYQPAERACRFAELMPHVKGRWAAKGFRITLEPWQIFHRASVFGWVHRDTDKRRFREADLFVPRKNAKSTDASVTGNFMLAADDEFGAEVYSGATSQDQAMEVFRPSLLMARMTPLFLERYGVSANASNLAVVATNSKFEPVIGKPGDGASPSCAIIDEYHEHKTPELYDTMKTGMGAREQPLLLVITTAGTDIGGPCYLHQVELQKILEGVVINEQRFGIIYTADPEDDWTSETALIKANPNFGVSVSDEFLRAQQRDAIADPRKQNIFKTKHLNIWVAAASPWLNLYHLQRCGDPALDLDAFQGERCIVGLDLASTQDIASVVYEWKRRIDDEDHYYVVSRHYVPEAALMKPENAHYQAWVNGGHLIKTPGNMIDLEFIQEEIIGSAEIVVIGEVAKDPWGGQQMGSNLANEGFAVVDIPQQVKYLSAPMKDIAARIDAGHIDENGKFVHQPRFHHDGNPAYVWMMSNVEVAPDRNENIFPRKLRAQNKIDGAVATIVAHNRAMANENTDSIYNERGIIVV